MNFKINFTISSDMDPTLCGELMLCFLNPYRRWGYSTREFDGTNAEEAKFTVVTEPIDEQMADFIFGDWYDGHLEVFECDEFKIYLHWDGDGLIIFEFKNGDLLYNFDVKNDHDWKWTSRARLRYDERQAELKW